MAIYLQQLILMSGRSKLRKIAFTDRQGSSGTMSQFSSPSLSWQGSNTSEISKKCGCIKTDDRPCNFSCAEADQHPHGPSQ